VFDKENRNFELKDIRLLLVAALIALFSLYYTEGKALSQEIVYEATLVEDGVAYGELIMGAINAPVTIVEYASLTCSHCATFHKDIFSKLKPEYIDTGKVRFIMRNIMSSHYDIAAVMQARCLGPEVAWSVMDKMFITQHDWLHGEVFQNLRTLMTEFGVGQTGFDACFQRSDLQTSLVEIMTGPAQQDQVTGTPTLFIESLRFESGRSYENIKSAIDEILESN